LGFEVGGRIEQVIMPVRLMLQKGLEWGKHFPVYIFSGDVLSAFDYLHPLLVLEMLKARGTHARLISALMFEGIEMQLFPEFFSCDFDERPIPFTRSAPQGGTESPEFWNDCMRFVMAPLVQTWNREGWGVQLNDVLLHHINWADNVFLFAR
jgi:hypothetical protein